MKTELAIRGGTLPRRIDLARDGAGGPMSVKLVIDAPVSH